MMVAQGTDYSALGVSFLTMGVGLAISLGVAIDPVFLMLGLPFAGLGIVFLARGRSESNGEVGK